VRSRAAELSLTGGLAQHISSGAEKQETAGMGRDGQRWTEITGQGRIRGAGQTAAHFAASCGSTGAVVQHRTDESSPNA